MPLSSTSLPVAYMRFSDGAYPFSESQVKELYPNTSFPVPFSPPPEFLPIFFSPQPVFDPVTHGVRESTPVAGMQQWEVYPLAPEQVSANQAAKAKALQDSIMTATQARLDAFAKTRNYDSHLSLCTYATDPNPNFRAEGQYGVEIRSITWAKLYEILAEVQAGVRPVPAGFQDIESDLPVLEWPV